MPAVAALGAVAIAALIVLAVFAVVPLTRVLTAVLGVIPFGIGAWVQLRQLDLVAAVYNALSGWAGSSSGALADTLRRVTWYTWRLHDLAAGIALRTYSMGVAIVTVTVPRYYQLGAQYAQALHAQALNYARALHAQALSYTQQVGAQALQFAEAIGRRDVQFTQQVEAQALQFARTLDQAELQYTQQVGAQAFQLAEAIGARNITYTQQVGAQVLDQAEHLSQQDQAYARALAAAVAVAGVAATAAVGARVTQLEDSPCQQFCGPLGELGGLLQGLEDAGLLALVLALIKAARTDPRGTEQALGGLFRPLFDDALAGLGLGH